MLEREIVVTKDGSHTVYIPAINEHYHSVNGAVNESMHVFIHAGLFKKCAELDSIKILEVGLGTGLNALLTIRETQGLKKNILYNALEPYPLDKNVLRNINYLSQKSYGFQKEWINTIHSSIFDQQLEINPDFIFKKTKTTLQDKIFYDMFDLIYFDAFSPEKAPEMWEEGIFRKLVDATNFGGILVTYCCKGEVKRTLKRAGFEIEKLPGAIGKREMLRAAKY